MLNGTAVEVDTEDMFSEILGHVGLLNANRNEEDKEIKLSCIALLEEFNLVKEPRQKRFLLDRISGILEGYDATKCSVDRRAKLNALRLIEELRDQF